MTKIAALMFGAGLAGLVIEALTGRSAGGYWLPALGLAISALCYGIAYYQTKKRERKQKRITWMQEIARRRGISEEQLMQEIDG